MSVEVFVEGGGKGKALQIRCREGFRSFFEKAGLRGRMPRVIACGSRGSAYDRFRTAVSALDAGQFIVLLVVSETAYSAKTGRWHHLRHASGDNWERPENSQEENLHFMAQCMESWFLADRKALARFFGDGYNEHAIPERDIEQINKGDVFDFLDRATRSSSKGRYSKSDHSYPLLGELDPALVAEHAPCAQALIETLKARTITA